jgi:hypothetical protein
MRSVGRSDPPRNQTRLAAGMGECSLSELAEAGEVEVRSVACGEHAPDVDHIIRDDAQADPALHAGVPFVSTAIQTMSAFHDTDAPLTPGAPFLPILEPAFLCSRLRSAFLVDRFGMHTRVTPFACAPASFFIE